MAVSKRTRFEVLRRDNYTCRYCRSASNELTVDHVTPVALGGLDDPTNLVAACRDCNAGKGSSAPDQAFVADVDRDALRWARAISVAAEKVDDESAERDQFLDYLSREWMGRVPHAPSLPDDWAVSAWAFFKRGLPVSAMDEAIDIAAVTDAVPNRARWKYFCGICWNKLRALEADARALIESGEVV